MTVADLGRAGERTALAWQRTALSLIIGGLATARLTWSVLGAGAVAPVGVAAALATWVLLESRYRSAHDPDGRSGPRGSGGRTPLALAIAVTLLAVTELATLLVR